MLSAAELKTLLRTHGLRLTKRLGQHHLIDAHVIRRIAERSQLSPRDTVVEIGAGLGALTEALAVRAGRVIAVEVDRGICGLLAERMRAHPNVSVVRADILEFDWARVSGAAVIGAIPYHITSPIIVSLCEARRRIRTAVLVIQEEVAERLLAKPGTKAYGRLTVLAQYGWEIDSLFPVPRSAFFPQPAVDSRCLRLCSLARPAVAVRDEPWFFAIVKAAFAQRRKTLVNCLSQERGLGLAKEQLMAALRKFGWPLAIRGETLSLAQFAPLANELRSQRSPCVEDGESV